METVEEKETAQPENIVGEVSDHMCVEHKTGALHSIVCWGRSIFIKIRKIVVFKVSLI